MPQRVVVSEYDEYGNRSVVNTDSSSKSAVTIIPNDVTLITATKGIYLGATGDLVVTMSDGNDATYKNLSGGIIHPISAIRIKATGTTATNIIANY